MTSSWAPRFTLTTRRIREERCMSIWMRMDRSRRPPPWYWRVQHPPHSASHWLPLVISTRMDSKVHWMHVVQRLSHSINREIYKPCCISLKSCLELKCNAAIYRTDAALTQTSPCLSCLGLLLWYLTLYCVQTLQWELRSTTQERSTYGWAVKRESQRIPVRWHVVIDWSDFSHQCRLDCVDLSCLVVALYRWLRESR